MPEICPICGEERKALFPLHDGRRGCFYCQVTLEPPTIARDAQFRTPIAMHSIGVTHPQDVQKLKEKGVRISDNPRDPLYGVPIARTRQEKLKNLKIAGFVERN